LAQDLILETEWEVKEEVSPLEISCIGKYQTISRADVLKCDFEKVLKKRETFVR